MALTKTLEVKIGANTTGFAQGLRQVKAGLSSVKSSALSAAKAGLTLAGVAVGIQQLGESFKTYLTLESSVSRINDLFASSAKYIADFAENTASSFGIAESSAYKYAAVYGNLFRSITASTDENAKVTTAMLRASAVVASKTGRTMDDVMERIRSGLLGNTEAIEDLGIQVNVANLELTDAFKKIADGRSWDKLNYREQQQIRTLAILEQAQKSFGDEVAKGSSYSLSALSGAFSDLQSTMGMFLNAALQPVIKGLTELVRWANAGLKSVAAYFGFDAKLKQAVDGTASLITKQDGLTDSVNDTVKAQKRLVAGFDEVNVITQPEIAAAGTTGVTAFGTASVFDSLPELELDGNNQKLQEFSANLKKIEPFFVGIGNGIKTISDAVSDFYDKYLYNWLVGIGDWIAANPQTLEKLGKGLTYVVAALLLFKGLKFLGEITGINTLLGKLAQWVIGTKSVTKAMLDKNEVLTKQTQKTNTETAALGMLCPALLAAAAAAAALGKGLSGLKLPDILKKPLPIPEPETVIVPAIDTETEYLPSLETMLAELKSFTAEAQTALETWRSKFQETVSGAWSTAKANFLAGKEYITNTFTLAFDYVAKASRKKLSETVQNVMKAWNSLTSMTHTMANYVGNTAKSAFEYIASSIIPALNSAAANTAAWVNNSFELFTSWARGVGETAYNGMKSLLSTVGSALSKAWEGLKNFYSWFKEEKIQEKSFSFSLKVLGVTSLAGLAVAGIVLSGGALIPALAAAAPPLMATAFADGGVISEPTLGLVGEYPGAAADPEIISPKSAIYDTVVEANAPMVAAIVAAVQRLEATVKAKNLNVSIGDDEIARSAARGNNDYLRRTGRSLLTV